MSLKLKSHSGAKKRFRLKSSGKVKKKKQGLRHLMENKSSNRKRHLTVMTHVDKTQEKTIRSLLTSSPL